MEERLHGKMLLEHLDAAGRKILAHVFAHHADGLMHCSKFVSAVWDAPREAPYSD